MQHLSNDLENREVIKFPYVTLVEECRIFLSGFGK